MQPSHEARDRVESETENTRCTVEGCAPNYDAGNLKDYGSLLLGVSAGAGKLKGLRQSLGVSDGGARAFYYFTVFDWFRWEPIAWF